MKKLIILILILLSFCFMAFPISAQEDGRVEVDASALTAGNPFRFAVTVNSDEGQTFAEAAANVTAVLCPVDPEAGECRTMDQSAEGTDTPRCASLLKSMPCLLPGITRWMSGFWIRAANSPLGPLPIC